jgi:hypothetical protein
VFGRCWPQLGHKAVVRSSGSANPKLNLNGDSSDDLSMARRYTKAYTRRLRHNGLPFRGDMTITLDYRLSPSWNRDASTADLSSVTASELHYKLFLGDVEFRIGEADFSAPWGWVPVLDFAVALRSIVRSLPETHEETFDFTESDATLRFVHRNQIVSVTSNYTQGRIGAEVSIEKLGQAADEFFERVIEDLYREHPELKSNPEMEALKAS